MTGTDVVWVTYRGREFMIVGSQDDDGLYGMTYYEKDLLENQRSDDIQWVSVDGHGLHFYPYRTRVAKFSNAFGDLLMHVDEDADGGAS